MLYVQRIGSPDAKLLAGTDGATYPFWSPDSSTVAFFANSKLLRVPVSGGTPQRISNVVAARGGSWGNGDVIVFAPFSTSSIWRVNPDGSGLAPVTKELDSKGVWSHRWPVFLPDGNHFLFWNGNFLNAKDDQ